MLLKKIVVAEDDDAIAHLVAAALGDAGFLCLRAHDGDEAISLCRREAPDLLILDVMMPHLDGFEVAKRLKSDVLASRIPILMLTSLSAVDDRVKGLDAGADDYLAKPFDLRELIARVKALIRSAKRERDRNPTTNLPGSSAVEDYVNELLRQHKADAALLYLDVDHFDTYADAFGFHKADEVIAELGELVLERSRSHGPEVFVGHVGGDDFVVVARAADAEKLAHDLIGAFDSRVPRWYAGETGGAQMGKRMTLSIAVVNAVACGAKTTEDVAKLLAHAKRASRRRDESNVVVWKPEPS